MSFWLPFVPMLFVQRLGEIGLMLGWSPTVAVCIHWNATQEDGNSIEEGLRNYCMVVQNCMRKCFLGKRHSLLSHFISVTRSAFVYCEECVCVRVRACVCTHIYECVRIVYDLPLLPNNDTNGTFVYKAGTLRSVDWITQLLFQQNALVFIKSTRYYNLYFLSSYS
jgi:hypothetical protein